ncbi:redox-regulated ATPase YchF [Candidatus Zixiibacteriota bacterium]
MNLGIIGLPNVGKSTLFNALTKGHAPASNYPFTTIDQNVGVAIVSDERLEKLGQILKPPKLTPTHIDFVDIAGLVKGASHGEGLGNQFLGHIRNVDCVVHVVRCFEDGNVAHVDGKVDPLRDIAVVETELILADLEMVERRLSKTRKLIKTGQADTKRETALLERIKEVLEGGRAAESLELRHEDLEHLHETPLLTLKPQLYVANIDEAAIAQGNDHSRAVAEFAAARGRQTANVSSKLESELTDLSPEESLEFLKSYGVTESSLQKVIGVGYRLLDLITFYTIAGENEVRAWTLKRGRKAPAAAGKVHSDMEKGFIKAEVIRFQDLAEYGSEHAAREHGHWAIEGKDYIVQDGDLLTIKFHAR